MHLDQIIGVATAILVHAGVLFSGHLLPASAPEKKTAASDEPPTIALRPLPVLEPEPPEVEDLVQPLDAQEAPPADLAPPMQADVPAPVITSTFTQALQPPPPKADLAGAAAAITIPKGNFGQGFAKLSNLIDIKDLDQKPRPRFSPAPTYPYEMRRARISGDVLVGFIVDSEGNVVNPYIIRSSNTGFDSEALRTVQRWKFQPGKKNGKAVNTRNVQLPLRFNLANS